MAQDPPGPGPSGRHDAATLALVGRARAGDEASFHELYARVAPAVFVWASMRTGAALGAFLPAEDLVQEAWCRAWRRFAEYDPQRAPFRAWILGIAQHVLMHALREFHRLGRPARRDGLSSIQEIAQIPDPVSTVSRRLARDESHQRFVARLAELPDDDKELLLLRGIEELSHEEAASRLGITAATARKRWERLRERIEALVPIADTIELAR